MSVMLSRRSLVRTKCCNKSDKGIGSDAFNMHNAAVGDAVRKFQKRKEEYETKRKHHVRHIFSSVHALVLDDIDFVKTLTTMKTSENEDKDEVIEPEVVKDYSS